MLEQKEYKNWNEICEVMNWKNTRGKYKKIREKELSSICKWHKEGNKIIIDNIYNTPKEIVDNRKDNGNKGHATSKYSECYDLIANMVNELPKANPKLGIVPKLNLTLGQMSTQLGLRRNTYNNIYRDEDVVITSLPVTKETIDDFTDDVRKKAKNMVENALERLHKEGYIEYEVTYNIHDSHKGKTFLADVVQKELIEKIETKVRKQWGMSQKEVFLYRKYKQFIHEVGEILRDDYALGDVYYKVYSITRVKMIDNINEDIDELRESLRDKFIDSLYSTCDKRVKKIRGKYAFGVPTDGHERNRLGDDYTRMYNKLIFFFISSFLDTTKRRKDNHIKEDKEVLTVPTERVEPITYTKKEFKTKIEDELDQLLALSREDNKKRTRWR